MGWCNLVYPVGTLRICLEFPLARFQVCDSAKSGHPKVTTQRQDKFIRALSLRNQTLNACTFSHELRTITGVNVSDQTNYVQEHPLSGTLKIRLGVEFSILYLISFPTPVRKIQKLWVLMYRRCWTRTRNRLLKQ